MMVDVYIGIFAAVAVVVFGLIGWFGRPQGNGLPVVRSERRQEDE